MKTLEQRVADLHEFYESGETQSYEFRLEMLKKLRQSLRKHEKEAYPAFVKDYNKNYFETWAYEFAVCYAEIDEAIKELKHWMKPKKSRAALMNMPARGERYRDPFGVVLIVSPWNFPFNLTFAPLIGAIAGGNCAMVKVSSSSPTIGQVMKTILNDAYPENYITVVTEPREEIPDLFDQYFNMAFFTGGTESGRLLSEKFASHVSPVILELGGKSPVYIDKEVNMKECVDSLTWGKFANGGQICVCPDYMLVHEDVHDQFVEALLESIKKHQYDKKGRLRKNFCAIISDKQFEKVTGMIDEDKVIFGGTPDPKTRQIGPVVLDNVDLSCKCMQQEIFGPLVPIITVKSKEDAVEMVKKVGHTYNGSDGAQPLALYVYTRNKKTANYMISHVQSGGCTVNGTILHFIGARFNGVGFSGNGDGYHGMASYLTFTHGRTVLRYDRATPIHKLMLGIIWQRPVTDKIVRAVDKNFPLNKLAYFLLVGDCEEKNSKN